MTQLTSLTPLSQLRDIHLPQPIFWWPLAPGWYVLMALVIIIVVLTAIYILKRYQKQAIKRVALQQLSDLEQRYQGQTPKQQIAMELSKLLRQVALAYYPRQQVAHLQGQAWISFLDKTSPQVEFKAHGQALVTAPYQKTVDDDLTPLFISCKIWIKGHYCA